jgi:hypothetical protein
MVTGQVEETLAAKRAAWPTCGRRTQFEFRSTDRQPCAVQPRQAPRVGIKERDAVKPRALSPGRRRLRSGLPQSSGATQYYEDSGTRLAQVKRLHQVIIDAWFQPNDPVAST